MGLTPGSPRRPEPLPTHLSTPRTLFPVRIEMVIGATPLELTQQVKQVTPIKRRLLVVVQP
jgi:hypothetical protein